ncbi:MAG: energy transducer TonB [Bacteroidota bacterium]|nr:energy transducer TonB [Bacteroidota bacterium]
MAKIDLTSREWIELIFQGKNKEYGAYKMRSESDKRHNVAMIIITVVALVGFSVPKLIEMVKPKQREINVEVTQLSQLAKAEVKNDVKKPLEAAAPPPDLKSSVKFTAPVIKKDEEVSDQNQIKSQEELTNAHAVISLADVKGSEKGTVDIADVKQNVTQVVEEEKVYTVIEQMPQFPGGESELLSYIGKNLKYPVIAQENGIQGKVIVRFVVTKNGSVDKVEVVRQLDPACDKEAIRVIRSLPKFIPGKQNGVNVSVWYTLPITFKLE